MESKLNGWLVKVSVQLRQGTRDCEVKQIPKLGSLNFFTLHLQC